jgi:hypothetical protein
MVWDDIPASFQKPLHWRHGESSRAYDAVQLACALAVREDVLVAQPPEAEPPDVLFVSADLGLLTIARAEGFSTENPNNYA